MASNRNKKIRIVKGSVSDEVIREFYYNTPVETRTQADDQNISTVNPGDVYEFEFKYDSNGKGMYKLGENGKIMLVLKEFLNVAVDP